MMTAQPDLFQNYDAISPAEVDGLRYIPDFVASTEASELINTIDQQPWLTDLKRRVQHYGWKYDYQAQKIDTSMKLGPLPKWLSIYCKQLLEQGHFSIMPDQVIVNEYQPGQGISPHIDCVPCFGETIASLSFGSACVMELTHPNCLKVSQPLESNSLLVLSGDARYKWKHSIPTRKTDRYNGQTIVRSRRVSLTFRNVIV